MSFDSPRCCAGGCVWGLVRGDLWGVYLPCILLHQPAIQVSRSLGRALLWSSCKLTLIAAFLLFCVLQGWLSRGRLLVCMCTFNCCFPKRLVLMMLMPTVLPVRARYEGFTSGCSTCSGERRYICVQGRVAVGCSAGRGRGAAARALPVRACVPFAVRTCSTHLLRTFPPHSLPRSLPPPLTHAHTPNAKVRLLLCGRSFEAR